MATEAETITALKQCEECIASHISFVLQGGAGSGKTESLKELLLYIKRANPSARVICITHTNAAVREILSRVGDQYTVCTIHSFLYHLIGRYKKNIKTVIDQLFLVPLMERKEQPGNMSEKDYAAKEYECYKKLYQKCAATLFSKYRETSPPVCGKRNYDKGPCAFNHLLNEKIGALNARISASILEKDATSIYYNETKFNNFKKLSYGHDGLLILFHLLFRKYPLLGKIISDRYDYIFVDEYQDTQKDVLSDLLDLSSHSPLTVGLFGDSMQTIYEDGVGEVDSYITTGVLKAIYKPDNYRCSYEVINFINPMRSDVIEQHVAFKKLESGQMEIESDRHGIVKTLYTVVDKKPSSHSAADEKEQYYKLIDDMISKALVIAPDSKILILTNKAIAEKNGFSHLYQVFDDRYSDVKEHMEDYLQTIQALEIGEICNLYGQGNYNTVISSVRKSGYVVKTVADKQALHDALLKLLEDKDLSLAEAIEKAIELKLIKRSETAENSQSYENHFLVTAATDPSYQSFKQLFLEGKNTFTKQKKDKPTYTEEEFKEHKHKLEEEQFIAAICSHNLKFNEVLNYIKYINEETAYITMHKTKGTSIPSVIVVMEEFFWNDYDFSLIYNDSDDPQKQERKKKTQNLAYVSCSRARNNLVCLRVLKSDEIDAFKQKFPLAEEVTFSE